MTQPPSNDKDDPQPPKPYFGPKNDWRLFPEGITFFILGLALLSFIGMIFGW